MDLNESFGRKVLMKVQKGQFRVRGILNETLIFHRELNLNLKEWVF